MTAQIIDGKQIASEIESELREDLAGLAARGIQPGLTVLRVGDDPASEVYVRSKARKAGELGIRGAERHLPATITDQELAHEIDRLNQDPEVDGILLQLPLPKHLSTEPLLDRIDPDKDVDGFHPVNVGRLHLGRPGFVPCTPAGIIRLIESTGQSIEGMNAVVIGRSNIVGRPMGELLLRRNATVTLCHSRTRDIPALTRTADLVVVAIGRSMFLTAEMVRPGAIVIDVGMNRITPEDPSAERLDPSRREKLQSRGSLLVGDVAFAGVSEVAGWITPVPGGVGPMTIAMLMRNTVESATRRR